MALSLEATVDPVRGRQFVTVRLLQDAAEPGETMVTRPGPVAVRTLDLYRPADYEAWVAAGRYMDEHNLRVAYRDRDDAFSLAGAAPPEIADAFLAAIRSVFPNFGAIPDYPP